MASEKQDGSCKLCQKPQELRESHIASKFLWKQSGVTGDKRKFSVSSPTHPELDEPNRQDGFKEYLLCQGCEQKFSRLEDYAARALFGEDGPIKNRADEHSVWSGLNYASLKLFQMSILWRMGVSRHPFYCNVQLGNHAETLRSMLHSDDPGEAWRYGCISTLLNHGGKPILGIFSQPKKTKMFGHHCYSYAIGAMNWVHFVTSHSPAEDILLSVLQPEGNWVQFRGEMTDFSELRSQVESHQRRHKEAHQAIAGSGEKCG